MEGLWCRVYGGGCGVGSMVVCGMVVEGAMEGMLEVVWWWRVLKRVCGGGGHDGGCGGGKRV